ncbi:MAG: type II secretion system F family protein [Bryobacteraceae bacterium]
MTVLFGFLFLCLFAVILIVVAIGHSVIESRRKKQVTKILETVSAREQVSPVLLLDPVTKGDLLQKFVKGLNAAERLNSILSQSGLDWTLTKWTSRTLLAAFLGLVCGIWIHHRGLTWLVVPAFAVGFSLLPLGYVGMKRSKRLGKFEEQFPDALDFLTRAMRAGHGFAVSFELICEEIPDPLGKEFRTFFNEQNLGAPLETAMGNLVSRVPLLDVRFFASAVILQRQTGGNLGEILNRLSAVIRGRFQLKGKVKAASAHGRMTSLILTLLPVGTMLGLTLVAPTYLQSMADDPDGRKLITAAISALIMGFFIMRKITNIEV